MTNKIDPHLIPYRSIRTFPHYVAICQKKAALLKFSDTELSAISEDFRGSAAETGEISLELRQGLNAGEFKAAKQLAFDVLKAKHILKLDDIRPGNTFSEFYLAQDPAGTEYILKISKGLAGSEEAQYLRTARLFGLSENASVWGDLVLNPEAIEILTPERGGAKNYLLAEIQKKASLTGSAVLRDRQACALYAEFISAFLAISVCRTRMGHKLPGADVRLPNIGIVEEDGMQRAVLFDYGLRKFCSIGYAAMKCLELGIFGSESAKVKALLKEFRNLMGWCR